MSCILRISGADLDIDALLLSTLISADRSWYKGTLRSTSSDQRHAHSGANFLVSKTDLDIPAQQIIEATAFLEHNLATVAALASFPGVQQAALDFGVALIEGSVAVFFCLPPMLVQLAAQANIGIEVSSYLCSEDPQEAADQS